MPQDKPLRGPRLWDLPYTKNGKQVNFREALNDPNMESLTGKSNLETYGEQAQLDRQRANAYYKANPAARQYGMAKAAASSKANGPKKSGQSAIAKLQDDMSWGRTKSDWNDLVNKEDKRQEPQRIQAQMQSAKLQAEKRSANERAKSPASIQKGMAASTRKMQAASTAKKASPPQGMRGLLKIK